MVYNTYIRTYYDIHTYVRTRVYIRTYVRTMVYIHTYVHACIHTYNGIHTCVLWYTYTVLKITIRSCQSFIQIWHFIVDYQWFPHWKCTVNMSYQIGFGRSYTKMGRKMTCDRPLFWALHTYIRTMIYIYIHTMVYIHTYYGVCTYVHWWCM